MRHLRSCTIENLESLTDYNVQAAHGPTSPDPNTPRTSRPTWFAKLSDGRLHARAHFYLRPFPSSRARAHSALAGEPVSRGPRLHYALHA